MQGELGSDPCVFLVMLSDTESKFKYKDGFFTDSGYKKHSINIVISNYINQTSL